LLTGTTLGWFCCPVGAKENSDEKVCSRGSTEVKIIETKQESLYEPGQKSRETLGKNGQDNLLKSHQTDPGVRTEKNRKE
jgi:hypothetical protein